jgi:hypothetical protein
LWIEVFANLYFQIAVLSIPPGLIFPVNIQRFPISPGQDSSRSMHAIMVSEKKEEYFFFFRHPIQSRWRLLLQASSALARRLAEPASGA